MTLTDNPNDPRLHYGVDEKPQDQHDVYLILSDEERAKGFVRPLRRSYTHSKCHSSTHMGSALCETYARDPKFYGSTYCMTCRKHLPVAEFTWDEDGAVVGS